jgi:glycosidase
MPWGDRDIKPGKGDARDEAMREYYKLLLHIRHQHPALSRGDYTLVSGPQDAVLAYIRHEATGDDNVLVLVNREDKEMTADFMLPPLWDTRTVSDELSNKQLTISAGRITITMAPKSVRIFSIASGKVKH